MGNIKSTVAMRRLALLNRLGENVFPYIDSSVSQ